MDEEKQIYSMHEEATSTETNQKKEFSFLEIKKKGDEYFFINRNKNIISKKKLFL
jgi:hypothetical protein